MFSEIEPLPFNCETGNELRAQRLYLQRIELRGAQTRSDYYVDPHLYTDMRVYDMYAWPYNFFQFEIIINVLVSYLHFI